MHKIMIIIFCFCVSACTAGIPLAPHQDPNATPQNFFVCHGFGCNERTTVQLSKKQWKKIKSLFHPPAKTAEIERRIISKAIGQLEALSTKTANLTPDKGEAKTFQNRNDQMDCIDETVNTTLYLDFLDKEGVLHWHKPAQPIHRGYFIDGAWPHNTASIRELKTGDIYAVDSYYYDSGTNAAIVAKKEWLAGWNPVKKSQRQDSASNP